MAGRSMTYRLDVNDVIIDVIDVIDVVEITTWYDVVAMTCFYYKYVDFIVFEFQQLSTFRIIYRHITCISYGEGGLQKKGFWDLVPEDSEPNASETTTR